MNEDKLLQRIKDSADNLSMPSALEANAIKDKLKYHKQKKSPNKLIYTFTTIAAAALIFIISIWQLKSEFMPPKGSGLTLDVSETEEDKTTYSSEIVDNDILYIPEKTPADISGVTIADSYTQVYSAVESIKNRYKGEAKFYASDIIRDESSSADSSFSDGTAGEKAVLENSSDMDYSNTNLRETGVNEADVVKTDGKYIYAVTNSNTIQIIEVNDGQLQSVGIIALEDMQNIINEIYVDENNLVVIASGTQSMLNELEDDVVQLDSASKTYLYTYDISNRSKPVLTDYITQDGEYKTSRKIDEYIYLFTGYYPKQTIELRNKATYVPEVNDELISSESIYIPDCMNNEEFIVVSSVSINDPGKIIDSKAVISGAWQYYVSSENIYIINSDYTTGIDKTQIIKFHFKEGGITAAAGGEVNGILNDSFSIDEYEGNLRIVLTRQDSVITNNLYILDENLNTIGKIENLAAGETIRSARFMGDTGYFVTFRNIDPLFSVDLSNPADPQILGELKVTGFSEYLHFYGEDQLLGIGWEIDPDTGEQKGLKLSMFDISDPSDVKEIHKTVIKNVAYSDSLGDYRGILADSKKNLIGFSGDTYNDNNTCAKQYYLYSYDKDEGFHNEYTFLNEDPLYTLYSSYTYLKGLYVGDVFFFATPMDITSCHIPEYDIIDTLSFD